MAKGTVESYAQALLRIVSGFVFTLHGFQLLFGYFGGMGHGARAHFPSDMWVSGVLGSFGGPLILLGLYTRPVAFLLCGEMAVAYFKEHAVRGFWPITNGGEPAVLYCFIFLYLMSAGAGPWSLDRLIRKKT